jgi:hypothetical protein
MITINFLNESCETFFGFSKRNQCFSGGIGNGKTTVACQKALFLLLAFPGYRFIIARRVLSSLKSSTMETFFAQLDGGKESAYIESHNETDAITRFKNGSVVFWIHLDTANEKNLRGKEVNSAIIDQAEEIDENIYLTLNSRVGRWAHASVPEYMRPEEYPQDSYGNPRPPSYMMILVNPEYEYHWVWRRYHPDSIEWQQKFKDSHDYIECGTDRNAYDAETLRELESHDDEWKERFFKGKWGISSGAIHHVHSDSILTVRKDWLENLLNKSALYRAFDHGEAAPTCCTWWACFKGQHYCYREYYMPKQVISYHRTEIDALGYRQVNDGSITRTIKETYLATVADPQIFKKTTQKNGAFWTVANEYLDKSIDAPPFACIPADNNELGTRNRINEYLHKTMTLDNPLTGEAGGRRLYFITPIEGTNYGVSRIIQQVKQQKREILDTINGKAIYSDDRDKSIEDHAYDTLRYYVAHHAKSLTPVQLKPQPGTYGHMLSTMKALKKTGYFKTYGIR